MAKNVDGGGGRRGYVEEEGRWRCGDLAAAAAAAAAGKLHVGNRWTRQGKAAASAAGTVAGTVAARGGAAAVAAVGSPPCPSLSRHLR